MESVLVWKRVGLVLVELYASSPLEVESDLFRPCW